ncbi:hypothetical protein [Chryseobacterium sp. JV274]|uniref:hypothetical protein n=1 Tax=Chryseobacterium sp. JV274 TaxID=1932669 RepID=UPI00098693EB|nr:hypothetical protein [Chryseobacterium sp. JV274]
MIIGDVKLDNRNHIKSLLFRSNEKNYFLSNKSFIKKIDIYSTILKTMGLTEQLFGNGAERFSDCVEIKIAELNEKHKDFLYEEKIDLSTAYMITFGQSGSGSLGFGRTQDISPEIDSEIDRILHECAEKHLQKL